MCKTLNRKKDLAKWRRSKWEFTAQNALIFSMASNFLSSSLLSSGFPEEVQWFLLLPVVISALSSWAFIFALLEPMLSSRGDSFSGSFSNYFSKGEESSSSDEFLANQRLTFLSTSGLLYAPVVENPQSNACGIWFDPLSWEIPQAWLLKFNVLLNLCSRALNSNYESPQSEPALSTTREVTEMRSLRTATKSSPQSPWLEKALYTAKQRPSAVKVNK